MRIALSFSVANSVRMAVEQTIFPYQSTCSLMSDIKEPNISIGTSEGELEIHEFLYAA